MSSAGLGWMVFGAFVVASLVVAAVGAVRCIRAAGVAATQRRLELTQAHLAEADALVDQARAALASMQMSLGELLAGFGAAFTLFARAADDLRAVRSSFGRGSTAT
jgi:hypothetical protein